MRATRRQLLGAGALLLAGCTDAPSPAAPVVDPDDALRASAVRRETSLLEAYDAALLALPALAARLDPLRAEHAVHLSALTGRALSSSALPSSAPAGSAPAGGIPAAPAPFESPAPAAAPPGRDTGAAAVAVLARLARAEQSAAAAHTAAVSTASRPLAALLASLGASEASHPVALA